MVKMMPGELGPGTEIWITRTGKNYLKRLDRHADLGFTSLTDDKYWDLQTLSLLWETSKRYPENLQDILAEDSSGQFSDDSSDVHRSSIRRLNKKGYIDIA